MNSSMAWPGALPTPPVIGSESGRPWGQSKCRHLVSWTLTPWSSMDSDPMYADPIVSASQPPRDVPSTF